MVAVAIAFKLFVREKAPIKAKDSTGGTIEKSSDSTTESQKLA